MSVYVECYLVVKAVVGDNGFVRSRPSVRVTKGKPDIGKDEVPILIKLDLPSGLFKRPQLTAEIKVDSEIAPISIDADVQDNIAEAIRQQLGVDVVLAVSAPEPKA